MNYIAAACLQLNTTTTSKLGAAQTGHWREAPVNTVNCYFPLYLFLLHIH